MNMVQARHSLVRLIYSVLPTKLIRSFPVDIRRNIKVIILPKERVSSNKGTIVGKFLPHLEKSEFPHTWRTQLTSWFKRRDIPRVCIVCHVFFTELIPELLSEIAKIPFDFDLIITNSSSEELTNAEISSLLHESKMVDCIVLDTENRGRDILPLIYCVNSGILDNYEYIFKLHTKKSGWAKGRADFQGSGEDWRKKFFTDLIGDGSNAAKVLLNLESDIDLGIVTADFSLLGPEYWTCNLSRATELANRLEIEVDPGELIFSAGSMYACKALIIQGLRSLCLKRIDFENEMGQEDGTTAHAIERLLGILAENGGYEQRTIRSLKDSSTLNSELGLKPVKFISYYLPQFHADPINDENWGKNFTEWNNVTSALPNFYGHFLPFLPTELGFYDLVNSDVALDQRRLAKDNGISAFMYYYYNFGNVSPLLKPLDLRVKHKNELPFSLMWVNENWTRNWDGLNSEIILKQNYFPGWEQKFLLEIKEYLLHPDYLRNSLGEPIISIYRPQNIPNVASSLLTLRQIAREVGIGEIHILFVKTTSQFIDIDDEFSDDLAQGTHGFPPHWGNFEAHKINSLVDRSYYQGTIYNYSHEEYFEKISLERVTHHPGVLTRFDNTPRRGEFSHIVFGSNPYSFRKALLEAVRIVNSQESSENLVFINAWNEWAEGAVLEPSNRFGKSYLLAVREISKRSSNS